MPKTLSKENERFYSERLSDAYHTFSRDRIKKLARLVDVKKGRLLDIGCGPGEITALLTANNNLEPYGVDVSRENIEVAKTRGIKAKKIDLNKTWLPYEDNFFDVVVASEIIEHIYDSDGLIDECYRVLKKNGKLIISIPNVSAWYNRGLLMLGYVPHWLDSGSKRNYAVPYYKDVLGHIKAFNKRSLKEMLRHHKFKVEKVVGSRIHLGHYAETGKDKFLAKFFSFFEGLFSKSASLASNVIIRARKP